MPVPRADAAGAEAVTDVRLARAALLVVFSYVFLANAWLGDDAYITFRVIWNFIHGYGLTFNPSERVQAYTHPLWLFVLSVPYMLTREFFFTVTFVSWAVCVATGVVLVRWTRTVPRSAVLVGLLLSSKAFVDYTASGLENPLSYLLLALFYTRYLGRSGSSPTLAELRWYTLVAALAFLTRPDAVVLYVLPLTALTVQSTRAHGRQSWTPLAIGGSPAILWLLFATYYYGFPLPNTYYAKVANGIPRGLMLREGFTYLLNSLRWDPLTLGTVCLAAFAGWRARWAYRLAGLSCLVSVIYTIDVGGDFMSGRFFTLPFLVAAMVVISELKPPSLPWAGAAIVLYNALTPLVPVKTTASYDAAWPWRSQSGIKDERGNYHQATNVLFFSPFRELPDMVFARQGRSFRESQQKVTVEGSIGMFGLYAGPEKHVIDLNALSDPLLAHLTVSPQLYFEFYAGHYFRELPEGYMESIERDENALADPVLHRYYDRLRHVTRGSLFDWTRLRDIWALNLGRERDIHARYERRQVVALSIKADNERFSSDTGIRDPAAGTLRTSGREGFLQSGPGIPLKPGAYRVRWLGTLTAPAASSSGFVDVSLDGTTSVIRAPIEPPPGDHHEVLAQIDFTLERPTSSVEYRMWVPAGLAVTLTRIELYTASAIPHRP